MGGFLFLFFVFAVTAFAFSGSDRPNVTVVVVQDPDRDRQRDRDAVAADGSEQQELFDASGHPLEEGQAGFDAWRDSRPPPPPVSPMLMTTAAGLAGGVGGYLILGWVAGVICAAVAVAYELRRQRARAGAR